MALALVALVTSTAALAPLARLAGRDSRATSGSTVPSTVARADDEGVRAATAAGVAQLGLSAGAAAASRAAAATPASGSTAPATLAKPVSAVPRPPSRPSAGRGALDRLLSPGRFAHYSMVRRLAARHSVEFRLVMAIIASESGGDPEAVSPAGAVGLMQLMPDTAARLGVDPWDPEQNVEGAVRYLSSLLSAFRSVDLSLIAYNAGPGFASRYKTGDVELGAETRAFLTRVGKLLQ